MAKDAKIGRLMLASAGLEETDVGILVDAAQRMRGDQGPEWSKLIKDTIGAGLKPVAKAVAIAILSAVLGTVSVAATTENFVAKDKFMVNIHDDNKEQAKVWISYFGPNFSTFFGNKVEGPFAGSELRYQKPEKISRDIPIINELGGEDKSETTLTEMYSLMGKQGHGEKGDLLTNGLANIFYIRDADGVLRAVDLDWRVGGWSVRAHPVDGPGECDADDRAFSRNSVTV